VFAIVKVTVMVTDGERGRFVQPGDVRGWDRYAYVENNPLRYTDPSGHDICDEWGSCWEGSKQTKGIRIVFVGEWTEQNRLNILDGAYAVGDKLMEVNSLYQSPTQAFNHVFGRIEFEYKIVTKSDNSEKPSQHCEVKGAITIECVNHSSPLTVAHEMGHLLNLRNPGWYKAIILKPIQTSDGYRVSGIFYDQDTKTMVWRREPAGYKCEKFPCVAHGWDWLDWNSPAEEAGDMFMNWVWDGRLEAIGFAANEAGDARRAWMNEVMVDLVGGK